MLLLLLGTWECVDSVGILRGVLHGGSEQIALFETPQGSRYLYLPGVDTPATGAGFRVFDVSDPTNPEFVNRMLTTVEDTPYTVEGLYVLDTLLYIHSASGDLTRHCILVYSLLPDPVNPKFVRIVWTDSKGEGKYDLNGYPWAYASEDGLLYYGSEVWDVSQPDTPQFIGHLPIPRGIDRHTIDYPYLYAVEILPRDSVSDSIAVMIYQVNRDTFSLLSRITYRESDFVLTLAVIYSSDSSKKFLIVPSRYHPPAVDVTDPYNPRWVDVDEPWSYWNGLYATATADKKRVYSTRWASLYVYEADSEGPYLACYENFDYPEPDSGRAWYNLVWYKGFIYALGEVKYLNSGYDPFLHILQYPEDDTPEFSEPNLTRFRVPTFQKGLLKLISPREGWFDLKLFSSTGALVAKRRVYLKKGVNLVDIS